MKTVTYCLALVAMAVFTLTAFAQDPTLTSVEAKFDTTTNPKNQQTKLDVYVKNTDGQEVAKSEGNEGRWNKNSSHTISLQVESGPTKADVASGGVSLTLHPQGGNKWEFNYKITLKFSDDSIITKELDGCVLTQSDPTRTDSFN